MKEPSSPAKEQQGKAEGVCDDSNWSRVPHSQLDETAKYSVYAKWMGGTKYQERMTFLSIQHFRRLSVQNRCMHFFLPLAAHACRERGSPFAQKNIESRAIEEWLSPQFWHSETA